MQALLRIGVDYKVKPLMKTTYERGMEVGERIARGIEQGLILGIEQGLVRGIERGLQRGIEQGIVPGEQRAVLRQMESKFGPLLLKVKEQVEALSPEALARLEIDLLKAQTLADNHLDG